MSRMEIWKDLWTSVAETKTVNIIHVPVVIIIYTVVRNFIIVRPECTREIRVSQIYTTVNHGNDDIRRTCLGFPGFQ